MDIKEIRKDYNLASSFMTYFLETLKDHDDYLLPETLDDYVFDVFEKQGYWSGIGFSYQWNAEDNYFIVEPRTFVSYEKETQK